MVCYGIVMVFLELSIARGFAQLSTLAKSKGHVIGYHALNPLGNNGYRGPIEKYETAN